MASGKEASLSPRRLERKVAVITGGASGIGAAAVRLFVIHGASVVFGDVQDSLGEALAKELGSSAFFVHCDVTREEDVEALVNTAVSKYGRLDIMYNNAGIVGPPVVSIVDLKMKDMDAVFSVNVKGAILGTKYAARVMIPSKKGVILSTASIASVVAGTAPHPYTISKFAMAGMVKTTAFELAQHGIRVNCISPHAVPTPMAVSGYQSLVPQLTAADVEGLMENASELKGAALVADDIANAALFLASDDAKYISGHNLLVDGGFTSNKTYNPFPSNS
uniref:Momilactone A synthase n=1 Tax=Calohypnum plumiforme TaxID=98943 RepID=A0A6F8PFR7_9BRYO|nr:momilactone A synthase [Calohypnum plumiforme]